MKFVVRKLRGHDGRLREHVFYWCGGCGCAHSVPAERWHWNGSVDSPTLSPSVRHFYNKPGADPPVEITTCHYTMEKGVISYCGDSPHKLKGQKVPLQEIPADYGIPDDDQ